MGNMPMKFGYNLRTLKMTHTRMGGDPYAYVSNLKFSKFFKISHTHILDSREHAPKVLAHLEQVDFDPYAYGCIPYAYDCNLKHGRMGGFWVLKLIDGDIFFCTIVRGTCPCVLVKKCVID